MNNDLEGVGVNNDSNLVPSEVVVDDVVGGDSLPKKRRYNRKQPTLKQIKALQYMNQGMTKRSAMLKAGYSVAAANHPKQALMEKKSVRKILRGMADELQDVGLTQAYMANKVAEFMEASKIHSSPTEPDREVPDYQTQVRGYNIWKDAMEKAEGGESEGKVKRKLTIEEFVTDGQQQQQ